MDPLEITYDSIDLVPEAFRSLYQEKDGKAVLTGISGIKTQADINNVQEALRKERADHAAVRDALKGWKGLGEDPTEIQSRLDRIAELEAAAEGKIDDNKIQQIVESRIGQKTAPLERKLQEYTNNFESLKQENETLKRAMETRDMTEAVRAVATEMKVVSTAIPDIEMIAASYLERDPTSGEFIVKGDAKGVTPGSDIRTFMKEMQKVRPHWWPQSQGGGAGGGGGAFGGDDNPWSAKGWNLTKQGEYVREHGMAKAQEAAKAAGVKIGERRPAATK